MGGKRFNLFADRGWGKGVREDKTRVSSRSQAAEEAQEGQSKVDFIAKMSISSKEARDTRWWLEVAVKTRKSEDR